MQSKALIRTGEGGVLLLLVLGVLWRGGKGLEMTWLLAGLASLLLIASVFRTHAAKNGDQHEVSLFLRATSLLFMLWMIISYAFSSTQNYGLDEVFRTSAYVIIFLWVAHTKAAGNFDQFSKRCTAVVYWTTLAACLIGAAIYILQPVSRFVGPFVDMRFTTDYWPNAWASFVLAAWPLAVLHVMHRRAAPRPIVFAYVAGIGVMAGCLLASYSRGGLIACALQLTFVAVIMGSIALHDVRYRERIGMIVRRAIVGILSVALIAVGTFFALNAVRSQFHTVQSITEKVTFTAAEGTSSVNERALFWKDSFELALEKPILGWGPYSFRFVQPRLMTGVLQTSDHPHNVLLKIFMEMGLPGLFLALLIVGTVMAKAAFLFFFRRKAHNTDIDASIGLYAASVIGVLLHSMIDFNLQFVGVGLITVLSLGMLTQPAPRSAGSFNAWKFSKILTRTDVVLGLLLLCALIWEGKGLVLSSFGRHAHATGNKEEALEWYEQATGELLSRDMYLAMSDLAADAGNLDQASAYLTTYESLNAEDPRLWRMKGDIALRSGKLEEALDALLIAYEHGKYTDLTITRLLVDVARRVNSPLLQERKMEFDELFSAYAESIQRNDHFIALSQNPEELKKLARLLAQQYPADAERYNAISRSAFAHAIAERERFNEKPAGRLW